MPSSQTQVARLDQEKASLTAALKALRSQLAIVQVVPAKVRDAEDKLRRSRDRASRRAVSAARGGELDQAKAALAGIETELDALVSTGGGETEEEKGEHAVIVAARRSIGAQREDQARQFRASLDRIDQALAALPAPFDASQVQAVRQAVEGAQRLLAQTEHALMSAVRDQQMQADLDRRSAALQARMGGMQRRIGGVEEKLGVWALFAKSMSNDGVIALAIDDAGPTLAGLANDLLLACYGPRFTVSIRTLVETAKGEAREGFDIVVHDAESGDAKSVTLMSGGERVWIDGALTRAIALYLAQNSGRRYETLFSDEADGALDAQRKRMFMSMKREVVRLGGYRQEFFVSQTPELTAMADAVIDLDRLALEEQGTPC
jgi:exonuclease SbcC